MTLGDGYTRTLNYDYRGRLVSQTDTGSTYGLSLGYAPNNNVTSATDSANGTWTYGYDDFNRLNSSSCTATCPNASSTQAFSYTYDQFGNRWQQNVTAGTGGSAQYSFNSNNQISGSGVTYDAAGNMMTDGLGNTYTYDAENRLVSVSGNYSLSYVYDAFGNRVEETNGATSQGLVYDLNGRVLRIFTSSGPVVSEEGYAGNTHLFTYTSGGFTQFHYRDWLGTLRAITSYSNSQVQVGKCVSLAFGDGQSCSGSLPSDTNFFTDQRTDPEGMIHFPARVYSPVQGRWGVPDPAGLAAVDANNPQTWNRYAYVMNNPLTNVDPDGLECVWDDGSYDDAEDEDSGSPDKCRGLGGTWVDHQFFADFGLPDWSGSADAGLAFIAEAVQNGFTLAQTGSGLNGWNVQAPPSAWLDSSWWGIFLGQFLTFSGGPGNVPTCTEEALRDMGNTLNPFTPGPSTATELAGPVAQGIAVNRGLAQTVSSVDTYVAQSGLTVPLRSSVVRAMIGEGVEGAAAAGWRANAATQTVAVDYAASHAAISTSQEARNGTCAAAFPIF